MDEGNGSGFDHLVDDLVIEILRRIPAEQLWWRCRPVCKRWKALISSPSFAHAHLQQSPPTFFVFNVRTGAQKTQKADFFYPRDDDAKRVFNGSLFQRWNRRTRSGQVVLPIASCHGLVLFKSFPYSSRFHIGNPITGELLTVEEPWREKTTYFCGFFFQSSTQEYKVLVYHKTDSTENSFQYALHTLGITEWRSLRALPYNVRCSDSPPVVLDNTLYWMISNLSSTCENSILMFSMDGEEFRTMSHPKYPCKPGAWHQWIKLLEMDGRLTCWCLVGLMVQAWVFEVSDVVANHIEAHTHWTRIYVLDLTQNFTSYMSHSVRDFHNVNVVSIQNRELILLWHGIGVFRYNLLRNTLRRIELERNDQFCNEWYPVLIPYTKTLVSFKELQ
ncbi:hypothetical protein V6N13_014403 [Hibiscus sabdariffa]|uniref:F-box domain-containing protein n=1 Tax=Hibiscus sabdariffa TaxID=183260 RepID=A0ABR2RVR4_9ROSI